MNEDDWRAFFESGIEPPISNDERAVRIADALATGVVSPFFLQILEGMIRPRGVSPSPFALQLVRKKSSKPKKVDRRIGLAMVHYCDDLNLPFGEARARVEEEFGRKGTSITSCNRALAAERADRKMTQLFEELKEWHRRRDSNHKVVE